MIKKLGIKENNYNIVMVHYSSNRGDNPCRLIRHAFYFLSSKNPYIKWCFQILVYFRIVPRRLTLILFPMFGFYLTDLTRCCSCGVIRGCPMWTATYAAHKHISALISRMQTLEKPVDSLEASRTRHCLRGALSIDAICVLAKSMDVKEGDTDMHSSASQPVKCVPLKPCFTTKWFFLSVLNVDIFTKLCFKLGPKESD